MDSSSLTSPSVIHPQPSEVVENNRKNRVIDINLPCDLDLEQETDTKMACVKHEIDLNCCIIEDEAGLTHSVTGSKVKIISGIDLESPAVPEEENIVHLQECEERADAESSSQPMQEKDVSLPDEFIRSAAEGILAISLSGKDKHEDDAAYCPSGASMTDPLQWFVELVSSFGEDLENKYTALGGAGNSSEDYFESMTLRLTETKEEDYMPKPLVPENHVLKEVSTPLLTRRTRRGHARRGRQQRDFQNILPGVASLSRHEVTEDLQTFEGMMRATGQIWHSGLTRRNGCGRGRRRSLKNPPPAATANPPPPALIQLLDNVGVGLEDMNIEKFYKEPGSHGFFQ